MYGTLISSVTVGSGGASTIDFTSIPQTYTDLVVVMSGRIAVANTSFSMRLTLNGASTNYSGKSLYGTGSTVTSSSDATSYLNPSTGVVGANATSNTFSNVIITIPNYTASTNKSVSIDAVTENNGTAAGQVIYAGLWASTAAITSLSMPANWNYDQYSTAYLYGLTKGSGGATVS